MRPALKRCFLAPVVQTGRLRHVPNPLLCLLAVLLVPSLLLAQGKTTLYVDRYGIDIFANLLHEEGLKPLASIEDLKKADPAKTVIIVLGRTNPVPLIGKAAGGLRHFLDSGGALLIASDYPDQERLEPLGLGISGVPVFQSGERRFLGKYSDCPVLETGPVKSHPLLKDLPRPLVTMRPSVFTATPGLDQIGWYGPSSYKATRRVVSVVGRNGAILASPAKAGPGGRELYLTGHGLFMNCFLVRTDYANFHFARNAVRWLAEGPRGARTHVLLLENNDAVQKLDLPLSRPEIPWAALMNLFVDQVQRQGLMEELVRRNASPTSIWKWSFIIISALMAPFVLRRFVLARFRRDSKATLLIGLQNAPPPPWPPGRQRQAELLRRGNLAEPARILVRQWLKEQTGAPEPLGLPPCEIHASGWRRRGLEKQLDLVSLLADPGPSGRLSPRRFRRLPALLTDLTRALLEGEICFVLSAAIP